MFGTIARRAASSSIQVGRSSSSGIAASAARTRISTNITGVDVHPSPLSALKETYQSTLKVLAALPEESVYRNATSAVTNHRLGLVDQIMSSEAKQGRGANSEEAIAAFEEQVDQGLAEEVLDQAKHELKLAAKMVEWKPHEPLEHPPPPGQWTYFNMAEENKAE
ncbi:unnamed protein product [Parajaminaea phylloscopi]